MTKTKQLLITVALLIPLFMIMNKVADNSKNQVKANIDICELIPGERGFARGQVISVEKADWGNKLVLIGEGAQGCRISIKTNPNQNIILQQIGNRVKVLIKVDTEYSTTAIGNTAKEDRTVIGADGSTVPIESTEQKISRNLLERLRKYEEARLSITDQMVEYVFTKELLNQIEPSKLYRWYYQTDLTGSRIVVRVEALTN
ncbi:MAG: hypothetical protein V7K90_06435 [Nostoc sp.]|uniref:hypothetical protein n=1 Tax=Nostoc sp. TaxID=1180 RepID=UPI002FFB2871